jgi:hypothetical protein
MVLKPNTFIIQLLKKKFNNTWSRLKELMEEILIMQINLKVCQVIDISLWIIKKKLRKVPS